jgi:hypothetical protein
VAAGPAAGDRPRGHRRLHDRRQRRRRSALQLGQWAAVVPPTSLPPAEGTLQLQVRYPVDNAINTIAGLVDGFPLPQTIEVASNS